MAEARARALGAAGDWKGATELVLELYGDEIYVYLSLRIASAAGVEDIFQLVSIAIWRGLERFEWRSSLRTWAYAIARRVAWRALGRDPARRERRLATAEQTALAARAAREATARYRRVEAKHWLSQALDAFDEEDRDLLVLRVYKRLPWSEIAVILSPEEQPAPEAIKRDSATLRKRYERLKKKLVTRRDELLAATLRPTDPDAP